MMNQVTTKYMIIIFLIRWMVVCQKSMVPYLFLLKVLSGACIVVWFSYKAKIFTNYNKERIGKHQEL